MSFRVDNDLPLPTTTRPKGPVLDSGNSGVEEPREKHDSCCPFAQNNMARRGCVFRFPAHKSKQAVLVRDATFRFSSPLCCRLSLACGSSGRRSLEPRAPRSSPPRDQPVQNPTCTGCSKSIKLSFRSSVSFALCYRPCVPHADVGCKGGLSLVCSAREDHHNMAM